MTSHRAPRLCQLAHSGRSLGGSPDGTRTSAAAGTSNGRPMAKGVVCLAAIVPPPDMSSELSALQPVQPWLRTPQRSREHL